MNKYLICIALVISGCATTYNGPKPGDIVSTCYAEKRDLYLVGDCFEQKMTGYFPGWRESRNRYEILEFTDFIRAKGLQVKDGYVSEQDGYREVMAYNYRKTVEARAEQQRSSQASAVNNAALIQAGAMLMLAPPPAYAPPVYIPPYPSDTTTNVQQGAPYRFYDSRPYK